MEQYLLLAKRAKGRALVDLIQKASAEPGIFAFAELLDLPNVKEVRPMLSPTPLKLHLSNHAVQ